MPIIFKAMSPSQVISPMPPGPPTNLSVSSVTFNSVGLSWNSPSSGASSYNIYKNGSKIQTGISGTSFTVSGLSASTQYTFWVTAVNSVGESAPSNSVTPVTSSTGNSIILHPGFIALAGTDDVRSSPGSTVSAMISRMNQIAAADVNNVFTAFMVPLYWATMEIGTAPSSPTDSSPSRYDGSWDSSGNSGFALVAQIISAAKAMTPPRGIFINVNCVGNGLSIRNTGNSGSGYPSWFAPAYMSNTAYGNGTNTPNVNGFNGVEWVPAYNLNLPPNQQGFSTPTIAFWRNIIGQRQVALIQAYYAHFGFDSTTGGILGWDPICEISGNAALTFSNSEWLATLQNTVIPNSSSGFRGVAPRLYIYLKPTFLVGNTANATYQPLLNLMKSSYLAVGEEDTSNKTGQYSYDNWGALAYRGISTFNGGTNQNWPNHVSVNDMSFVCNADNSEMGGRIINGVVPAVPPAQTGTGYLYDTITGVNDNTGNPFRGIMQGVNTMNAHYMVWHTESFQAGPNVNRGPATTSSSAPANPAGGPNPGSSATRPNLVDVITNNPSYAGLGLKPMPIPNNSYPNGWPP